MFALAFMIWAGIAAVAVVLMGLMFAKKPMIGRAIFAFVVIYFFSWLTLPPLAFDMLASWVTFTAVTAFAAILVAFSLHDDTKVVPFSIPVLVFVAMLVGMFTTSSIFNADEMAGVIDVTDHGQKETTIELASQEQARRVTPNLALKKAAELIGSAKQPGLASVAKYGTMYGNVLSNGKAVWVAPLQPSGFFRWWGNPTTPGYFVTSHVNPTDSRLVEDKPISYGDSGFYWDHDLFRHLYINGYVNYDYGDPFFQVDDEGVPHYVVPLERPQVGFWSYFPEKWVVVNASTGEIKEAATVKDLPEWVDRAFSLELVQERLADWGCLSAGFRACWFTGVEVIDPTPSMVVTMDSENRMIYYTGTQFQNNKVEGATSGVATINARTGKVDYYRRSGITETAAVDIINGAVANYAGRTAENPVLVLVNGFETYFSVITDESGAKKGFGMVWQRNRDVFGIGDTVSDAMRSYLRSIRENRNLTALEGGSELEPVAFNGLIVTITSVVRDGETAFYMRLDSVKDKVFVVNTDTPAEVATSNVGEPVRVTTFNPEPATIEVDTFDNLELQLTESEDQVELDRESRAVVERYRNKLKQNDASAKLRELDPDQVNKLLEMLKEE